MKKDGLQVQIPQPTLIKTLKHQQPSISIKLENQNWLPITLLSKTENIEIQGCGMALKSIDGSPTNTMKICQTGN